MEQLPVGVFVRLSVFPVADYRAVACVYYIIGAGVVFSKTLIHSVAEESEQMRFFVKINTFG